MNCSDGPQALERLRAGERWFIIRLERTPQRVSRPLQNIYRRVAPHYELVNRLLTFGLDGVWRKRAARLAARRNGARWLDVCSGTGELAENLQRLRPGAAQVHLCDFSLPMLSRAKTKEHLRAAHAALADAADLPYRADTFDLVAIGFATRNINPSRAALTACLREFHRLLAPGGIFVNLETSQPPAGALRWLLHAYARLAVPPIGALLSGSWRGYAYLAHTIVRFYAAGEFAELLREAGFRRVETHRLLGGVAAIHLAVK